MPVKYQFFAPTDAARLGKLQLTARAVVEGVITGMHKSPHRGFSVEFSEHREYVPGDELRHLDWRAYARSDRYYIKLYEQETNLRACIVLDVSASMNFASAGAQPKIDYARHLAACLAYLLAQQQDMVGLVALDDQVRLELPPGSAPSHLDRLFRELEAIRVGSSTALPAGLHALSERLPRRTLFILISDLWTDPPELTKALQHLRYRRHQGMVLHLLDRAEIDLDGPGFDRQVMLQDLETMERIQVEPAELRETYKQQVQEYLTAVRRVCNDSDVEYHPIFIQEPYDKALVKLIHRRS